MSKFKPKDRVIAISDTGNSHVVAGDRHVVQGYCIGCGALLLEATGNEHFQEHDFVLSEDQEKKTKAERPRTKIDEQLVIDHIRRLTQTTFLYSQHGLIPIDVMRQEIVRMIDGLSLKEKFFD